MAPKIGDVITFTYDNYSRRAAPINPKLQRIRFDISWEQILMEFEREDEESQVLSGIIEHNGSIF